MTISATIISYPNDGSGNGTNMGTREFLALPRVGEIITMPATLFVRPGETVEVELPYRVTSVGHDAKTQPAPIILEVTLG